MVDFARQNSADVIRQRKRAVFLTFPTLPDFIRQAKGARKMNLRRGRDAGRECAHGHALTAA